jgi:hydrogenase maturation protease
VAEADPAGQPNPVLFDGHGMQPDVVFGMLRLLGAQAGRIVVVGCEPARVDYGMELSEPVAAAVDKAVRIVLDMVADLTQVADLPRDTAEGVADVPWHTR